MVTLTFVLFIVAVAFAIFFEHGGKMFAMCVVFAAMQQSCDGDLAKVALEQKRAADCLDANYPGAVALKLFDEKGKSHFKLFCIDDNGGLHKLPSLPMAPAADVPQAPTSTDVLN